MQERISMVHQKLLGSIWVQSLGSPHHKRPAAMLRTGKQQETSMSRIQRRTVVLASLAAATGALSMPAFAQKKIVLGFSQIGAESEWRTANSESIKSSAKEAGIELKFADAQQKQENQIKAIRSFIAQKVDVIAFSPVVESGWGTVLREAKAAKIPVILSDRAVDEKDTSLWVSFMGSDFVEEGRKAGRWLLENSRGQRPGQHRGAARARWARHRPSTARRASKRSSRPTAATRVIRSQTGDFTRAKGKEVMEAFLKAEGKKTSTCSTRTTTTWPSAPSRPSKKRA